MACGQKTELIEAATKRRHSLVLCQEEPVAAEIRER